MVKRKEYTMIKESKTKICDLDDDFRWCLYKIEGFKRFFKKCEQKHKS